MWTSSGFSAPRTRSSFWETCHSAFERHRRTESVVGTNVCILHYIYMHSRLLGDYWTWCVGFSAKGVAIGWPLACRFSSSACNQGVRFTNSLLRYRLTVCLSHHRAKRYVLGESSPFIALLHFCLLTITTRFTAASNVFLPRAT